VVAAVARALCAPHRQPLPSSTRRSTLLVCGDRRTVNLDMSACLWRCAAARRHRRCRAGLWLALRLRLPTGRLRDRPRRRGTAAARRQHRALSRARLRGGARTPRWWDLDTPKVFRRPGTNFRYRREPLTFAYVTYPFRDAALDWGTGAI